MTAKHARTIVAITVAPAMAATEEAGGLGGGGAEMPCKGMSGGVAAHADSRICASRFWSPCRRAWQSAMVLWAAERPAPWDTRGGALVEEPTKTPLVSRGDFPPATFEKPHLLQ